MLFSFCLLELRYEFCLNNPLSLFFKENRHLVSKEDRVKEELSMTKEVLLGDEALALAAIHAGLTSGYSYPGTPASEIMEYLIRQSKSGRFKASWCVNEKVAYEQALGVSFTGKRTLVSMKHVGLNVAADPFMNSALTEIRGGMVVVAADDPGMHSSQNEQDSRYFARFARIFCMEPSDHQEAYDITRAAYDISEQYHIPVMIRMVTRLSHSRSVINTRPPSESIPIERGLGKDWTLLPSNARRRFKYLMDQQPAFVRESEKSPFNRLTIERENRKLGIIASGIAYQYVRENMGDLPLPASLLKISNYPLPADQVRRLADHVDEILVCEDGYPFIEERISGLFGVPGKVIRGRLSGDLPITGELTPDLIREAMGLPLRESPSSVNIQLSGRPPQLCSGCPHADTFKALNIALEKHETAAVFSDIGCYTLSALPPYNAIDTCVCMGASISMAKGAADAGLSPAVGVIGDSTFGHSGMTALLDAASNNTPITLVIVDNATVAMTGGQPSYASGETLLRIIRGLGVADEHIRVITPLPKFLLDNSRVIDEEIAYPGTSVIVASRVCVQELKKKNKRS
jgi:indolepyruvate ferredoxin oxidoreductase alpha subunit